MSNSCTGSNPYFVQRVAKLYPQENLFKKNEGWRVRPTPHSANGPFLLCSAMGVHHQLFLVAVHIPGLSSNAFANDHCW